MSDSITEILPKDWAKLRDLYVDRKNAASAHNTIQMFINWYEKNPLVDVKIYTLNDDWQQDGTFLAYTCNQIICNTLNYNLERLLRLLKCFDRGTVFVVGGFQQHALSAVQAYISTQKEPFKVTPTIWYYIEEKQVQDFDLHGPPSGLSLVKLNLSHVELINSFWGYSWPTATKFIENMILYNESVGVVDMKGNLVGWCLLSPIGTLALLHVLDTHKRQGLGSLLVRHLSHKVANKNLRVLTSVVTENTKSRDLFDKLGFKPIDIVYWAIRVIDK